MSEQEQMSLLTLWPCNGCNGSGRLRDREGDAEKCPTCGGSGTLDYDPEDKTEIPF